MINRAANEQTKGSDTMDWHGDLTRGYHGAYLIGLTASPAVPADTPATTTGPSAQNLQRWQCMRRQTGVTLLRELKLHAT